VNDVAMLTDDEVIALSELGEWAWQPATPTVDGLNPEDRAAASIRGSRSLFVRDLLPSQALGATLDGELGGLRSSPSLIDVFLGDSDHRRASWGLASTHFEVEGGWIADVIDPLGIHVIGPQPSGVLAQYLERILENAVSDGPRADAGADGEADRVCVLRRGPFGALLLVAQQGDLRHTTVDIERGELTSRNELLPIEPSAAVAFLLTSV
jgi:hypothetical protein